MNRKKAIDMTDEEINKVFKKILKSLGLDKYTFKDSTVLNLLDRKIYFTPSSTILQWPIERISLLLSYNGWEKVPESIKKDYFDEHIDKQYVEEYLQELEKDAAVKISSLGKELYEWW